MEAFDLSLNLNEILKLDLTEFRFDISEVVSLSESLNTQLNNAAGATNDLSSAASKVKDSFESAKEAAKETADFSKAFGEVLLGIAGAKKPTDLAAKVLKNAGKFVYDGILLAAEEEETQEFAKAMSQLKKNVRSIQIDLGEALLPTAKFVLGRMNSMTGDTGKTSLSEILNGIRLSTSGQLRDANDRYAQATALIRMLERMESNKEDSAYAGSKWVSTLNALIATVPELSEHINLQTGEITGGTKKLYEDAETWQERQKTQVRQSGLDEAIQLYRDQRNQQYTLEQDIERGKALAESNLRRAYEAATKSEYAQEYEWLRDFEFSLDSETLDSNLNDFVGYIRDKAKFEVMSPDKKKDLNDLADEVNSYLNASKEAENGIPSYQEQLDELPKQLDTIRESVRQHAEEMGLDGDAVLEAIDSTNAYTDALLEQSTVFDQLSSAMDVIRAYRESVIESMRGALDGVTNGFEAMGELRQVSVSDMMAGLASQQDYMEEYNNNLKTASELGIKKGLLAILADGSEQSAAYLAAIVADQGASIEELNKQWEDTEGAKDSLAMTMADARLEIDEEYDQMVKDAQTMAQQTVDAFDRAEEAKENGLAIAESIASGLALGASKIAAQVSKIQAELSQLGSFSLAYSGTSDGEAQDDSAEGRAVGLDYVPYDDYYARLHEGEAVLTKAEATDWRRGESGGASSVAIDYDRLASSLLCAVSGLAVQMDGQAVGHLVAPTVSSDIAEGMTTTRRYAIV